MFTSSPIRRSLLCLVVLASGVSRLAHAQGNTFINPPGLSKPNGYTHVVLAADRRTVYVAGQIALDSAGQLVGAGDFRVQAERVFENLRIALTAVGAGFADVVKTTTYITEVRNVPVLREIRARYLDATHPPANTVVPVATLARPDLLIEIEVVAVMDRP
jgi:enamine deaminase RidA (YjgF/YER057c/UK114 family)